MSEMAQAAGRQLAVILPGIGYTCDRPLLYYSARLAASLGRTVVRVPFGGFPPKAAGNAERLLECADLALAQTREALRDIFWAQYADILFISKSIGTAAAAAYARERGLPCRHVLFTPLALTLRLAPRRAIAFHGTADPWADTPEIRSLCSAAGIPLHITERANHSLETGDVMTDVRNLERVMAQVKSFMQQG